MPTAVMMQSCVEGECVGTLQARRNLSSSPLSSAKNVNVACFLVKIWPHNRQSWPAARSAACKADNNATDGVYGRMSNGNS